MRIGFVNLQAGVGMTGKALDWALGPLRYALPHAPRFLVPLSGLVKAERVDVLGCVETELPSWRGAGVDYTLAIARATGLSHGRPFPTLRLGRWVHQGNSLHGRLPFRRAQTHELPGAGQRRVAGEARLHHEGREWTFLVTHLALGRAARVEQLRALGRLLSARPERTVLMGDFNTVSHAELRPLEDAGYSCAATGPTHPSWRPSARLDRLYASPDLEWTQARAEGAVLLSDHQLVVAEVRRKAEALLATGS